MPNTPDENFDRPKTVPTAPTMPDTGSETSRDITTELREQFGVAMIATDPDRLGFFPQKRRDPRRLQARNLKDSWRV